MPMALAPGEICRLEFRGCSWSAVNAGSGVIAAGSRARIERVDGLTLVVRGDAQSLDSQGLDAHGLQPP